MILTLLPEQLFRGERSPVPSDQTHPWEGPRELAAMSRRIRESSALIFTSLHLQLLPVSPGSQSLRLVLHP